MILASYLITPYYLSFWTALNYYGYTEQPSRTVFAATIKSKTPVNIKGIRFQFVKFKPEKFFGFKKIWLNGDMINMAEREKTIIDCLDQPRYCGETAETAKGLWNGRNELDFTKVIRYAEIMENRAVFKRLGYLMETLKLNDSRIIKKLRKNLSKGYAPLEPLGGKKGTYNNRWRLFVNVDPEYLTEWRER